MKEQTVWMHPNQIFVISGGASANSLFLEDHHCHQVFFDYFNRFVSPMVKLLHYKLTHTGWVLLIKIKKEAEIKKAYLTQRLKSDKADRTKDLTEPHRMLSEHIRMFLSNFAKRCNQYLERSGVWVKKRFDKILINNEEDYFRQFELICDLQACNYQQIKKKYQPDEGQYDIEKEMLDIKGSPHILRSSLGGYRGVVELGKFPAEMKVVRPFSDVLRKILIKAKNYKNPQNSNPQKE